MILDIKGISSVYVYLNRNKVIYKKLSIGKTVINERRNDRNWFILVLKGTWQFFFSESVQFCYSKSTKEKIYCIHLGKQKWVSILVDAIFTLYTPTK